MAQKTSRNSPACAVAEGECWAIPLPGLGYCALIVARVPSPTADVPLAFIYLRTSLSEHLPSPDELGTPESWPAAWLGLVSLQPFVKGRWKRCGSLRGFDRQRWPLPPARASAIEETDPPEWRDESRPEMWSIEVRPDEPTMTLIANVPATRDEAKRFPIVDTITAASSLEKSLVHHFKNRRPSFWDARLMIEPIGKGALNRWHHEACRMRAAHANDSHNWLPAGRATDRALKASAWLALPLTGGGFGAAMLVAKPEKQHLIFSDAVVMGMRRRWERWPTFEEVMQLEPDDGALIGQTSMICVRDGRWRVLGYHPHFTSHEWIWPLPWTAHIPSRPPNTIAFNIARDTSIEIVLDPSLLRLGPLAGGHCRGSTGYTSIEYEIAAIVDGTHRGLAELHQIEHAGPATNDDDLIPNTFAAPSEGLVTPARLAAWRKINAAIEQAVARHVGDEEKA